MKANEVMQLEGAVVQVSERYPNIVAVKWSELRYLVDQVSGDVVTLHDIEDMGDQHMVIQKFIAEHGVKDWVTKRKAAQLVVLARLALVEDEDVEAAMDDAFTRHPTGDIEEVVDTEHDFEVEVDLDGSEG